MNDKIGEKNLVLSCLVFEIIYELQFLIRMYVQNDKKGYNNKSHKHKS